MQIHTSNTLSRCSFPSHHPPIYHSINYLHCGRPKSWYSIPPHAARRFESMAQGLDPDGYLS